MGELELRQSIIMDNLIWYQSKTQIPTHSFSIIVPILLRVGIWSLSIGLFPCSEKHLCHEIVLCFIWQILLYHAIPHTESHHNYSSHSPYKPVVVLCSFLLVSHELCMIWGNQSNETRSKFELIEEGDQQSRTFHEKPWN